MRALRQVHLAIPAMVVLGVALLALLGAVPSMQPAGSGRVAAGGSGAQFTPRGGAAARCVGFAVGADDDLQRAVDTHLAGTTFCLGAGVHRLAQALPKDRQRFIGVGQDTILSGARTLAPADARRDHAGRWYWPGQTQQSTPHGTLGGTAAGVRPNQGDRYNEELFVTASGDPRDSPERYQRVLELAELGPGRWYLDEAADRVYLSDDPARRGLIETSIAPTSIAAPSRVRPAKVAIENLVVEKYASPAQQAAVGGEGAIDWDFRHVTVRYNHGAGAELGPGTLMRNCKIDHMGQIGLLGGGDATGRPTILRDTEVADNKVLSFDPDWEAGGAKFTRSFGDGMIVENSWFHDNAAGGLWFDIDNFKVVIRSNRFQSNDRWGLLYEVSRDAKIYWNEAFKTTNGPENFALNGAGILISNSAGVDVHSNLLWGNDNGVLLNEDSKAVRWAQNTYRQGLPHIQDVDVHDNDISMQRGVTGMQVQNGDASGYWQPSNAQFVRNTYRSDETEHRFMGAGNHLYSFDEWKALGNDLHGSALPGSSAGSLPKQATAFAMSQYGAQDDGG